MSWFRVKVPFWGRGDLDKFIGAWTGDLRSLRSGTDINNTVGNDKLTAVHLAANNSNIDVIRLLKEMGADISAKANNGGVPMHYAALNGHVDAIKALKEMGGDISAKDNVRRTPFQCAQSKGHLEVCQLLTNMGYVNK